MSADPFAPATISGSWLRLALMGPTGSGKTMSALRIGTGIANELGGRIAVIDSEHGKSRLYAGRFAFNVLVLPSYEPERYIRAIEDAEAAGYSVLIIDSLSHAWAGRGGILEFVDQTRELAKNKWTEPWGKATPRHQELFEAILRSRMHVIATMRTKMEYIQQGDGPSAKIMKVGMAPIQRDGVEYEFDIDAELDINNELHVWKSRYEEVPQGLRIQQAGEDFGKRIIDALTIEGAPPPAPPEMTPPPPIYEQPVQVSAMDREEFGRWFWGNVNKAGFSRRDLEDILDRPIKASSRQDLVNALGQLQRARGAEPPPEPPEDSDVDYPTA